MAKSTKKGKAKPEAKCVSCKNFVPAPYLNDQGDYESECLGNHPEWETMEDLPLSCPYWEPDSLKDGEKG